MRLIKLIILLVTMLVVCNTIKATDQIAPKVRYKIGMTEWVPWVIYNVADTKGYFKEEGVNVEVTVFPVCYSNVHSLLKDKSIDIAVDMIGTWISTSMTEDEELVILGEFNWSDGGDKIISRTNNKYLQGVKEVYIYSDMLSTMIYWKAYLDSINKDVDSINIVPIDTLYLGKAYLDHKIDVVLQYDPEASRLAKDGFVLSTTKDFPGIMPEGLAMRKDLYDVVNKNDIVNIIVAILRACEWTNKNLDNPELMDIIRKTTLKNSSEYLSDEDIKDMLKNVKIHNPRNISSINDIGGNLYEYIDRSEIFLSEMYGIDTDLNYLVRTYPLQEACARYIDKYCK